MAVETAANSAVKTRFLTLEKQEHLVKLAILIIAAVLCEYKHLPAILLFAIGMQKKMSEQTTKLLFVCVCVRITTTLRC